MSDPPVKTKKPREPKEIVVIKNTYDYQRMKLDRLMKNPEKPVQLPERVKEKKSSDPPDFVRNVMGSSAGAGSGEFHVYRHIRRREYARQKNIQVTSEKERKDEEFQQRIEDNQKQAEERTAKKRAKRLKKKQLNKKSKKGVGASSSKKETNSSDSSESSDEPDSQNDSEQAPTQEEKV